MTGTSIRKRLAPLGWGSLVLGAIAVALLFGIRWSHGQFPRYDGPGGLLEVILLAPFVIGMLLSAGLAVLFGAIGLFSRRPIAAIAGIALGAFPLFVVFNLVVIEPAHTREQTRQQVQRATEDAAAKTQQSVAEFARATQLDESGPLAISLAAGSSIGPIRTPGHGGTSKKFDATGRIMREPGKAPRLELDVVVHDEYFEIGGPNYQAPLSTSDVSIRFEGELTRQEDRLESSRLVGRGMQKFSTGEERSLEVDDGEFRWFAQKGHFDNATVRFELPPGVGRPAYAYLIGVTVKP